jgi:hypothetical protein
MLEPQFVLFLPPARDAVARIVTIRSCNRRRDWLVEAAVKRAGGLALSRFQ